IPLSSFMVTIFTKTLLHGIVFCFMNFLLTAASAMLVYNSCVYLPNIDGSFLTMEIFQRYWQHKKYSDQINVQKISSMSSSINPCKLHNGNSMGILYKKLIHLKDIAYDLSEIHRKNIIHCDFHSGNILISEGRYGEYAIIGDLGLSKPATEAADNENYSIIHYITSEILQGKRYAKASDIYSFVFGMIMWECMTCRRPFWVRAHDTELIIDIYDGLRPPVGNIEAPQRYFELIKECLNPDPSKRPISIDIMYRSNKIEISNSILIS
ncbi:3093_t:CDS:2, partial [Funneliformis geosporum]